MCILEAVQKARRVARVLKGGQLSPESVGYFTAPHTPPAYEPTDNRCPICGAKWTDEDVRTYSLMAIEGPASGVSLFYRTHRTCAEVATEEVIGALDAQAMAHAAAGRLIGRSVSTVMTKTRKSMRDSATDLPAGVGKADAVASPEPIQVHGLTIIIDRPAGFVQTKTDDSGAVLWTREYTTPYGYIEGTAGGDGEELDVFVGPAVESTAAYWFCVCTETGEFDEYKVVLCAESDEAARAIILAHIPERFVMPGCAVGDIGQIKALLGQDPVAAAEAIEQVSKALDAVVTTRKRSRTRKALDSATAYKGDTMPLPPEMQTHPALTAPITETYDPADVGGWVGVMEPDDGAWVAFVDINGRCLLWTQRDPDGGVVGLPYEFTRQDLTLKSVRFLSAVTKAAPAGELRYILGIVLEPEVVDGQGEIYSAEEIRKSAWLWMADFRNIDLQHKLYVNDLVSPVESYLAPLGFAMAQDGTAYPVEQAPEGTQRVLRGTWLLGAVVKDDGLWEQIKAGRFTGWSINGFSKKRPA